LSSAKRHFANNKGLAVKHEPLVSVIMNCYNGEKYLREAIDSVYAQTYQNWEVVLFDNASTDHSAEIAKSFDQKLRYFRNDVTVPLGQARNLALRQARGELIAFLDSDDVWFPAKLEKQIPLFENAPLVGLVFGDTILHYKEDGRSVSYFVEHDYYPPKGKIFPALLQNYSIPMLTAVIRKEVLETLDEWFDEDFRVCDDFDFFLRIAYKWDSDYVNEPLAKCLIHSEAATARLYRYAAAEKLRTLDKLRRRYPDIDECYRTELGRLRRQIAYTQGKSFWRDGKNAAARAEFRSYMGSPKFLVTYFATFLPYLWFEAIIRWLRRGLVMLREFRLHHPS